MMTTRPNGPLFKIILEQHAIPLDGLRLTQEQIISAQKLGDLSSVLVQNESSQVMAMVVDGQWFELGLPVGRWPGRAQLSQLLNDGDEGLSSIIQYLMGRRR